MKTTAISTTILIALAWCGLAAAQAPPAPAALGTPPDQARGSYLMGLQYGEQIRETGLSPDVDSDELARGVREGLAGAKLTPEDKAGGRLYIAMAMQAARERNKAAAAEFLATNGKQKGVVTTASGLQYRIVSAGNAKEPSPGPTDEVTVHYRGRLLDGREFDSSYGRGTPATFRVDAVIRGWQESLSLMKPGAKWQLWIPPDLAYGDSPKPGIPAASLLSFDVELLSVKSASVGATPK